mmetsp:Transcript_84988/g.245768  ORF Transcript_84988/g.245768 Transcript_84988/m.245768 type:complete len:215 (-) Transcript_84988:315-959(-)
MRGRFATNAVVGRPLHRRGRLRHLVQLLLGTFVRQPKGLRRAGRADLRTSGNAVVATPARNAANAAAAPRRGAGSTSTRCGCCAGRCNRRTGDGARLASAVAGRRPHAPELLVGRGRHSANGRRGHCGGDLGRHGLLGRDLPRRRSADHRAAEWLDNDREPSPGRLRDARGSVVRPHAGPVGHDGGLERGVRSRAFVEPFREKPLRLRGKFGVR